GGDGGQGEGRPVGGSAPAPGPAQSRSSDGAHRLVIGLDGTPESTKSFALHDPPRLVIDVSGVHAGTITLTPANKEIRQVRMAPHDGGLRVVLDLATPLEVPAVVRTDGKTLVVEIDGGEHDPTPCAAEPADGSLIRIDMAVLLHHVEDVAMNPKVLPGDVVSVSPAGSVLVDGWVDKPGSYAVTRGLTVSGAVAAAGGQLFAADRRHTTVLRSLGPGDERSFEVDLQAVADGPPPDIPITDGDVIRLPLSAVRIVPWGLWVVAREMIHIGGSVVLF